MNKKISVGVALALILLAMAVTVSVSVMSTMRYFSTIVNDVTEQETMYSFISEVDKTVRDHYNGTVDEETLRDALARGYAAGCGDPYAAYYTAEEYAAQAQALSGSYTGFGLEIGVDGDDLVVSAVYADSAAETAGIRKQDVLTAVDEEAVTAGDLERVNKRLENPSKVLLSVKRAEAAHSFTLSVSTISVDSVENRMLEDGTTGYLRIRRFAGNTPDQFRSALSAMEDEGASQYVFDLRDNEGGGLDAALDVLDYVLPRGAYARLLQDSGKNVTVYTSSNAFPFTKRLIVLINQKTAAEAELVAGALRECAGANLVGVTTVGHASVQEFFTLSSSGAAVRVTVGSMELASGGSYEKTGLTPDREVALTGETDFSLRPEKEDDQLQMALTMLNGAVVESTVESTAESSAESTAESAEEAASDGAAGSASGGSTTKATTTAKAATTTKK